MQVAAPGTSFNPDPEQHQAVLATAVAHEVGKGLERELGYKAPGQAAPATALAACSVVDGMDELAMLQVCCSMHLLSKSPPPPHPIQSAEGTWPVLHDVPLVKMDRVAQAGDILRTVVSPEHVD